MSSGKIWVKFPTCSPPCTDPPLRCFAANLQLSPADTSRVCNRAAVLLLRQGSPLVVYTFNARVYVTTVIFNDETISNREIILEARTVLSGTRLKIDECGSSKCYLAPSREPLRPQSRHIVLFGGGCAEVAPAPVLPSAVGNCCHSQLAHTRHFGGKLWFQVAASTKLPLRRLSTRPHPGYPIGRRGKAAAQQRGCRRLPEDLLTLSLAPWG
jgi:hypothetical protein